MKNPFIALKEVFFGDTESEEYYSEEDLYRKSFTEKYVTEEVRRALLESLKNRGKSKGNNKNKLLGVKVPPRELSGKGESKGLPGKEAGEREKE